MKKLSPEYPTIGFLKEQKADEKTADVCRHQGISSATLYKYKTKYGGLEVSDARKLYALEDENNRLKKLLADTVFDGAILRDVNSKRVVTREVKRNAAAQACAEHGVRQHCIFSWRGIPDR